MAIITGTTANDTLLGTATDDTINGLAGADIMYGGLGNDTYAIDNVGDIVVESAGEGIDTVQTQLTSYTLTNNVENLNISHRIYNVIAVGNELNNIIHANGNYASGGGADIIDGGAGADTMSGAGGSDTYYVDSVGDAVIENIDEGTDDTIFSSVDYTLSANVENMVLVGAGLTAIGNNLDNTYHVDFEGDTIIEAVDGGKDTVYSSLISYSLNDNVENLALVGNAIYGIGNLLNNTLSGIGTIAANVLSGGVGNDTYWVDQLDKVVENVGEGIDTVIVRNVLGHYPSTVFPMSYTLSANVENLVIHTSILNGFSYRAYGVGNDLDNVLTVDNSSISGNSDVLDGGVGADTMSAGIGNDTYYVDNVGDVVIEDSFVYGMVNVGVDTVISSVSYSLGANVENLTLSGTSNHNAIGNEFNNILIGNSGTNTLIGGLGDDTYIIQNAGDVVIENAGEGVDKIFSSVGYQLNANEENLVLLGSNAINGTGNDSDNVIDGINQFAKVNGWGVNTGANVLTGGLGNDFYFTGEGDTVVEFAGEGIDTVQTTAVNYTLDANVENLYIGVNGTGNELGNTLIGGKGNNVINGGLGADTMIGKGGNDVYYVDDTGDVVIESNAALVGDTDIVFSSISYALGANVEQLALTGSENINGTGNELRNNLFGNSGDNILAGGQDIDRLTGGAGADTFVFDTPLDGTYDQILDFVHGTDHIQLSLLAFSGLGAVGELSASVFASGAGMREAATIDQHIIYNTTGGGLFYDVDGAGGASSVFFASLTGLPPISLADFMVV
ncbi:MAG: hypothetical protein ABL911_01520 [Gallionella sp.]